MPTLPIPEVAITGLLTPTNSQDTYAVTANDYHRGGIKRAQNIAQRNSITPDRREANTTFCFVEDVKRWYFLKNGISNQHWVELSREIALINAKRTIIIVGDGTTKKFDITHQKQTPYFEVTAVFKDTKQICEVGITFNNNNTFSVHFATPPTTGETYFIMYN